MCPTDVHLNILLLARVNNLSLYSQDVIGHTDYYSYTISCQMAALEPWVLDFWWALVEAPTHGKAVKGVNIT
jgi:hypothetical protein